MEAFTPYVPSEVSARATPLINREAQLEQIRTAIADSSGQTWIFLILAPGGTGKTCLLQEVLRRCHRDAHGQPGPWYSEGVLAAREVVDLYHAYTHSEEGLVRAICAVLDPGAGYFDNYLQQRDRLHRVKQDLAEVIREVTYQRTRMLQAFFSDYRKCAGEFRVVLALDTVETIVHKPDRIQKTLGATEAWPGIQSWLVRELIPRMPNTVILIAGRPEAAPLGDELSRLPNVKFEKIELKPFLEEDTLAYFQAVAAEARRIGQNDTAARIEAIPEETRRVIHRYTGGRPILIALLVDYLAVADRLLPAVQISLEEAIRRTPDEDSLKQVQNELEAEIVRVLQETGRETDETLRALAWAPRGMDAELLACVSKLGPPTPSDVQSAEKALEKVRPLSFVKVRPADRRVFLHDEMYGLLEHHVLRYATEERKAKVNQVILDYYERLVARARQAVLQAATAEEQAEAYASLHNAQVDEVYYRLRHNALEGFQTYYRYAEESFQTNEPELDQQLHDELMRFFQLRGEEIIDSLPLAEVERDRAIRIIKWGVQQGLWDSAARYASQLRKECRDLFAEPLPDAELSLFEGWALIYQGQELARAEEILHKAIDTLSSIEAPDAFYAWRITIGLAYAHNLLGYLYRNRGRFQEAVREYRRALPYWRRLPELEVEHSNTLNNLAWACAEAGDFISATRYIRDALEMRERLGRRYLIALSLNTLGLIETRDDKPHRARVHCERALTIFRDLEQRRGVGLACVALAEALRREAAIPDLYTPQESADLLRQAERYAREALQIFSEEHKEPSRLVEALLELGCIYRDWANIRERYDGQSRDYARQELAKSGEQMLRRAAREAGERFPHRRVDALVNLAWLRYYIGDSTGARQVIAEEVFPLVEEYRFTEQGKPHIEAPITFIWVQLGKAHTLLGRIAFEGYRMANDRYRESRDEKNRTEAHSYLRQAAAEWTLALAYDRLFAADFRDLRRGMDRIYENVRTLNAEEMGIVYRAIDETAEKYNLEKPPALRLYLEETFGRLSWEERI